MVGRLVVVSVVLSGSVCSLRVRLRSSVGLEDEVRSALAGLCAGAVADREDDGDDAEGEGDDEDFEGDGITAIHRATHTQHTSHRSTGTS